MTLEQILEAPSRGETSNAFITNQMAASTVAPAFDVDMSRQMEYEQRRFRVYCDLCDNEAYAPEKDLRQRGWQLGREYAFCPSPMHD